MAGRANEEEVHSIFEFLEMPESGIWAVSHLCSAVPT